MELKGIFLMTRITGIYKYGGNEVSSRFDTYFNFFADAEGG